LFVKSSVGQNKNPFLRLVKMTTRLIWTSNCWIRRRYLQEEGRGIN